MAFMKMNRIDKNKKYKPVNINNIFIEKFINPHNKTSYPIGGMQNIGKKSNNRRLRAPKWTPSIKAESGVTENKGGNDQNLIGQVFPSLQSDTDQDLNIELKKDNNKFKEVASVKSKSEELRKVEDIGDGTRVQNVDAPELTLVPEGDIDSSERRPIQRRFVDPRLDVIPKPLSLGMRKDKKIAETYSKLKENLLETLDEDRDDNGESTTESSSTPESESCDGQNKIGDRGINSAVEESPPSIIRDKNYLRIYNWSYFDKKFNDNIDSSIKCVENITQVFGNLSDFHVKELSNATKESLLKDLSEINCKFGPSMKQLVIVVMSHGICGAFVTYDNKLVTHTELCDTLETITSCCDIKIIIILAHCQNWPQAEEKISFEDSDDGNDSQVDDLLISTKTKESKSPTSTNFPNRNVLIANSVSPGEIAHSSEIGSFFVNKIIDRVEYDLSLGLTVELVGIINKVIESFKELRIIHNGVRVYEHPYTVGVMDFEFLVAPSRDDNKTKTESGGGILNLPNLDPLETDLE